MSLPSISQFLIESSICLLVFYGFYALILRQETFFQLNRFYLLLTPLLSIVLPLVHLEVQEAQAEEVLDPWALALLAGSQGIPQTLERPIADQFTVGDAMVFLYLAGLTVMLLRLGIALYGLIGLLRARRSTLRGPAASFFGHILHRKDTGGDERDLLDAHEQVHARQWHSLDVLFLELLIAGYWFHPLIYGFRRQLKLIHEFIADALVVRRTGTRYAYARLLVRYSTARRDHPMLNTFASFTKKRLLMLKQQDSPAYRKIKYLLAIPLFVGLAALFSFDLVDDLPETMQQPLTVATGAIDDVAKVPLMKQVNKRRSEHVNSLPAENDTAKLFASDKKLSQEPLYIIDDKRVSKEEVQNLDINTLHAMEFLKGESALEEYGEPGRNGVVILTTTDERKGLSVEKVNQIYNHILIQKDVTESKMTFRWLRESDDYGVTVTAPRKVDPIYLLDGKRVRKSELKDMWETINVNRMAITNGVKAIETYGNDGQSGVVELYTTEEAHKNSFDLVMGIIDEVLAKELDDRVTIKNFNIQASPKEELFMRGVGAGEPKNKKLLIIDGHQLPPTAKDKFELVDPTIVKQVEVYTPDKAREAFGEDGRNGAQVITTKQGNWHPDDLPAYQSIKQAKEEADGKSPVTGETKVSTNGGISIRNKRTDEPPLYVIDGTPYSKDGKAQVAKIDPNDIASINVFKGETALKRYGADGADGVVEIWTKAGAAAKRETQTIGKQEGMIVSGLPKEDVVIVIDGEEFFSPEATQVKELDPQDIDYVKVYKDKEAREKYGNKARNGVIEITTKSGASAKKEIYSIGSEERMLIHDFPQEDVVFVVDKKVFTSVAATRAISIDPDNVKAIARLEGPAAQSLYGQQARNGAIVITRKSRVTKQKNNKDFWADLGAATEPLFILDGEELPADAQPTLQQVEPDDIDRINVYKGEQATEKFGKKGKHGVVEIFTKGYDGKMKRAERKKKGTRVTVLPPEKKETAPATIDWEESEMTEDTPAKKLNLRAFPNPADDVMTVSFTVPAASDRVNLALYDMDGRLLRVLREGSFPAGVQRFTIGEDLNLTSGGTFILRLAVGNQVQTQQVVFQ